MTEVTPNKLTSPYTRERAEQLQRNYLRKNSTGLSILCLGHVILGLVYGDQLLVLYFASLVTFGLIYSYLLGRLSHNTFVLLGEALVVSGVVGCHLVLPKGAACDIMLFPLGVTLLAFSQTILRGGFVFLIGFTLFCLYRVSGFPSAEVVIVPEFLSFTLSLLFFGAVLLFQINKARNRVSLALSSLVSIEEEFVEKEAALNGYHANLFEINTELGSRNIELTDVLKKEHIANKKLDVERVKQEGINKAIYRDLKNPLQVIKSDSKALKSLFGNIPSAKPVAPYLDFAIDGAERMDKMLDDLLAYTKGDVSQSLEPVDLNEVISTLNRDLFDLIERSGATVDWKGLPVVMGYLTQLTQLFQNLLSNALKFRSIEVSPRVEIYPAEKQDKEGFYMIRVRDNGVGIPANQLDSVFGLFNRAHAEEGYEGSGIGLSLCRRIAVAHGAKLTVTSVLGEGTQFTISFPLSTIIERGDTKMAFSETNLNVLNELY